MHLKFSSFCLGLNVLKGMPDSTLASDYISMAYRKMMVTQVCPVLAIHLHPVMNIFLFSYLS